MLPGRTGADRTCYRGPVRPFAASVLAIAALAAPWFAAAFRDAPPGTPIRQRTMPTVGGERAPLLAEGKVSVFVFVRAGQENTERVLRQLAQLEVELAVPALACAAR